MKRIFFLLTLFSSILRADIIETPHFAEITQYTTPDTLIVVDIDDTLLIPVQTLGTDVWFCARLKHHLQTETNYAFALDRALAEWEAIRHLTEIKIVEEGTQNILENMQDEHLTIMGLTTQGLALTARTIMQLNTLGIDLSRTAPSNEDFYFVNGAHGVLYHDGILFTAGTSKGKALVRLLDMMNYHPQRVVFINDKKTHLKDLESSLNERNIEFIGLRYSYSDERVANYSEKVAEVQWNFSNFGHILSDEEAALLIN